MRAILHLMMAMCVCGQMAAAQELTALARVDSARSGISDGWFGKTTVHVGLSQGVPFRVFLLRRWTFGWPLRWRQERGG